MGGATFEHASSGKFIEAVKMLAIVFMHLPTLTFSTSSLITVLCSQSLLFKLLFKVASITCGKLFSAGLLQP